jgi:hypothetical protein
MLAIGKRILNIELKKKRSEFEKVIILINLETTKEIRN